MNLNHEKKASDPNFLSRMKQDVKVITNVFFILEKLESDGLLELLRSSIGAVLNNEVIFALNELSKTHQKGKSQDLKNQLINNTYIFKENLKLINDYIGLIKS